MPEGMKWTLVGKVTCIELLVPKAGKKPIGPAHWGWMVEPAAIYVPGRTFAVADPELELGGRFAGEAKMEQIKSAMYTVKEVPKDVTPEQLTEIFVTAIKEKNYPLYLDCIDPRWRQTPKALDRCMYHWEWHQQRFATLYCDIEVGKATERVISGFDASATSDKGYFLTKAQREELMKRSGPLVKSASLTTRAFDERGRQYGSPKPRFFKKVADGRWYISNYPQPF
jgi:hypothetical protein